MLNVYYAIFINYILQYLLYCQKYLQIDINDKSKYPSQMSIRSFFKQIREKWKL